MLCIPKYKLLKLLQNEEYKDIKDQLIVSSHSSIKRLRKFMKKYKRYGLEYCYRKIGRNSNKARYIFKT